MIRSLLLGLVAAAIGLFVWLLAAALNLGEVGALMGVTAGLVLGLVPQGSPVARYLAFLIGLVLGILALILGIAGWVGYVVMVVLFTIVSAITRGWLPFWAMLLGAGTLAAAYAPQFVAGAWYVLTEYPQTLLLTMATSAGGFLIVIFAEMWLPKADDESEPGEPDEGGSDQSDHEAVPATQQKESVDTANGGAA